MFDKIKKYLTMKYKYGDIVLLAEDFKINNTILKKNTPVEIIFVDPILKTYDIEYPDGKQYTDFSEKDFIERT